MIVCGHTNEMIILLLVLKDRTFESSSSNEVIGPSFLFPRLTFVLEVHSNICVINAFVYVKH